MYKWVNEIYRDMIIDRSINANELVNSCKSIFHKFSHLIYFKSKFSIRKEKTSCKKDFNFI